MRRHWAVDLAIGGLSGIAASWVMERVQTLGSPGSSEQSDRQEPSEVQRNESEAAEPATVKAAQAVAGLAGKSIPDNRKHLAGELVHFGHGAFWGALYAVFAPHDVNRLVSGLAFGAGLWLVADELIVPLLGLAEGPTAYPPSVHGKALAAHLVYGVTTAAGLSAMEAVTA